LKGYDAEGIGQQGLIGVPVPEPVGIGLASVVLLAASPDGKSGGE